MKKIFSILLGITLLALCVGFSSCSQNDPLNSNNDIIGVWKFSSMTAEIKNPSNPDAVKEEQQSIALANVFYTGMTFEFKSDKTFVLSVLSITVDGTWEKKGNNTISITSVNSVDYGFWSSLVDDSSTEGTSSTGDTGGSSLTIKNGTLILTSNNLDNDYRSQGFTKYIETITFKK